VAFTACVARDLRNKAVWRTPGSHSVCVNRKTTPPDTSFVRIARTVGLPARHARSFLAGCKLQTDSGLGDKMRRDSRSRQRPCETRGRPRPGSTQGFSWQVRLRGEATARTTSRRVARRDRVRRGLREEKVKSNDTLHCHVFCPANFQNRWQSF